MPRSVRMISGFVVACVAIGASVAVAAALGAIRGVVHDPQHRPVPGATVVTSAARADWKQSVVTDAAGAFQFVAVPVGDYILSVSLQGFDTASQTVTVVSGATPVLHIPLNVATLAQSVTVSATGEGAQPGSVTPTTMVTRDDIQFTPGADRTKGWRRSPHSCRARTQRTTNCTFAAGTR